MPLVSTRLRNQGPCSPPNLVYVLYPKPSGCHSYPSSCPYSPECVERLFGNSEWVTNRGCESGQDGSKESLSAASYRQTSVLETPSAIFQTVSEKLSKKG